MSDREMLELAANWKADDMTREQHLNTLILISTLESLILAHKVVVPDYLFAEMERSTDELRKEILQ